MKSAFTIGVHGASGKIGKLIIESACENQVQIGYPYSRNSALNNIDDLFSSSDIVIDFSSAECVAPLLSSAIRHNKKLVIGTTGMDANVFEQMRQAGEKIAIFYSANMSPGINLLAKILKFTAASLKNQNYDAHIIEVHHKSKKDAPSGTALMLAKKIAEGKEEAKEVEMSETSDLSFHSIRAGTECGTHEIVFYGENESISFKHQITSRKIFAAESLKIAKWLHNMPNGFYEMDDYLQTTHKNIVNDLT
jgi:4-hydroxy-tetrahydrodipicolinate reductase